MATAYARRATGALGYGLRYGDGTSAPPIEVPQFCLAGRGRPVRQSWRFSHRYRAPGRFRASLSVQVNCGGAQATAALSVLATGATG